MRQKRSSYRSKTNQAKLFLAIILFIVGVALLAYPSVIKMYTNYTQSKLLEEWDISELAETEAEARHVIAEYDALQDYFLSEAEIVDPLVRHQTNDQNEEEEIKEETEQQSPVIGTIRIDKINVRLPIVDGATQAHLKYAAARLKGTGELGGIGNAAIAAHRSYTYGKFFNRLNEVEVGDIIQIETNGEVINYEVYKTLIVEPTDLSVLYRNQTDQILTLITCEPIREATHRLIVHAVANR